MAESYSIATIRAPPPYTIKQCYELLLEQGIKFDELLDGGDDFVHMSDDLHAIDVELGDLHSSRVWRQHSFE